MATHFARQRENNLSQQFDGGGGFVEIKSIRLRRKQPKLKCLQGKCVCVVQVKLYKLQNNDQDRDSLTLAK